MVAILNNKFQVFLKTFLSKNDLVLTNISMEAMSSINLFLLVFYIPVFQEIPLYVPNILHIAK